MLQNHCFPKNICFNIYYVCERVDVLCRVSSHLVFATIPVTGSIHCVISHPAETSYNFIVIKNKVTYLQVDFVMLVIFTIFTLQASVITFYFVQCNQPVPTLGHIYSLDYPVLDIFLPSPPPYRLSPGICPCNTESTQRHSACLVFRLELQSE